MAKRKSLAEYLGFIGLGCFEVKISDSDLDTDTNTNLQNGATIIGKMNLRENHAGLASDTNTNLQSGAHIIRGMKLGENHAALEEWRSDVGEDGSDKSPTQIMSVPESPELVPLREMLRRQDRLEKITEVGLVENTYMCCVCMGRKNRSVLIPCGHTFCGKCSRKLSFVHGNCPVPDCQYPFSEFLDLV